MKKRYENPPIVEVVCEFQFVPGEIWDDAMPELIYEKINGNFPGKQQKIELSFNVEPLKNGVVQRVEPIVRNQFFNRDRTALIQTIPNLFILNQLKPYIGWENFKLMIMDNFSVYRQIAKPKDFKRISLRYINLLEFSKKQNIKLKNYLRYYPFIPEELAKNNNSFISKVEFPFKDGKESLTVALYSSISDRPNFSSLLLDIGYSMVSQEFVPFDDLEGWLAESHNKIENTFESIITDKSRNLFWIGGS
ncbi:MAG: TIGR04255 family protein [Thermodesulfobium sp.]